MDRSATVRALGALAVLAGCGGTQAAEPTEPTEKTSPQVQLVGPPGPWEDLTDEQRKTHMMEHVLPSMSDMFRGYDANEFASFDCRTCHGSDAQARRWEMPSPDLPPLYPTGSPEQKRMVEEHPEMVRFMFNDVVPAMQTLLGMPAFEESTGEGFSCYYCHPAGQSPTHGVASMARGTVDELRGSGEPAEAGGKTGVDPTTASEAADDTAQ